MEIVRYEPDMAGQVAKHHYVVTRDVPHCYPVSEEETVAALFPAAGGQSDARLRDETAFVARSGSSVLGFAHVALEPSGNPFAADNGIIRFLSYAPGERKTGQALVDAAERHLRERTIRALLAFPSRYRFPVYHFANAYLSDHLDHVQALLAFNGY